MQEWINIVTDTGIPTGIQAMKEEAHKKGLYHNSVHIWLYTLKEEILIQLRHPSKINYPNLWDVSVAGHVSAGESLLNAAVREVQEELGITITSEELQPIGIHKSEIQHRHDYIDNEFNHIYCCESLSSNTLSLQQEEVSDVKLIPLTTFATELDNPKTAANYVPYPKSYYELVINEIRLRIG